jgi:2-dehydropantoate 2-reductase
MTLATESILIVGSGALACLFAARFAAVELPVTMLGNWPKGVRTLRKHGVHLIDTDGSEHTFPVHVIHTKDECQPFSHALVLVKSWQTERTARQLLDFMIPSSCVLTLQNGMGNREVLMQYLGEDNVFTGITTTGARLISPGLVKASGTGMISLVDNEKLSLFKDWFEIAGFSVQTVSDMNALIWGKLVVNAAINPLTALLKVPNGDLLHIQSAHMLLINIAREVATVATVKGISLPFKDPVREVEEVALRTGTNHSSMLQDIQRGAPTEIDAICGAIIKNGTELGVPTPISDTLYHLVKSSVEKNLSL